MFDRIKPNTTSDGTRLLARQLARELTKEELHLVSGGRRASSSSAWSCSGSGDGDDGGADD